MVYLPQSAGEAFLTDTVAMRCRFIVLLLVIAGIVANAQQEAFSRISAKLQAEVHRKGCQIQGGQSVIRGQFERAGVTDWAVLCQKGRTATLIVFWSGKEFEPAELMKTYDGDGQNLTVRHIVAVDRKFILKHCGGAPGKVPAIDHQGILDRFNGSVVHYYHQGAWIDLAVLQ